MKIEISDLIFKHCKITELEDLKGVIVGVNHSSHGVELKVRYFLNGEQKTDWFLDFDIELV